MKNVFFTADLHLGHANICRHTKRPQLQPGDTCVKDGKEAWVSKEVAAKRCFAMDEFLIDNWNSTVDNHDDVYFLGDFSFKKMSPYLARLNRSKLYFVAGNHDKNISGEVRTLNDIVVLPPLAQVNIRGQEIVLCHYALVTWPRSHFGAWMLHGHSHGSLAPNSHARIMDVGVDCHPQYRPFSFAEIGAYMQTKTFKAIDHHENLLKMISKSVV